MGESSIYIAITVYSVLFALAVFVPIFNLAFGISMTNTNDIAGVLSEVESTKISLNYFFVVINIFSVLIWTFGLNVWINLFLMILRIAGGFALYYIIFPTK